MKNYILRKLFRANMKNSKKAFFKTSVRERLQCINECEYLENPLLGVFNKHAPLKREIR